jgi:hypothetical protein
VAAGPRARSQGRGSRALRDSGQPGPSLGQVVQLENRGHRRRGHAEAGVSEETHAMLICLMANSIDNGDIRLFIVFSTCTLFLLRFN